MRSLGEVTDLKVTGEHRVLTCSREGRKDGVCREILAKH